MSRSRRRSAVSTVLAVALLAAAPARPDPDGILHRYALEAPLSTVVLPPRLREVSGLTVDDRGRLWAHDDEVARIYELDPATGAVRDAFDVGRWGFTRSGDWEGLAWAEGRFYLVDSDGLVLEFPAGTEGERVAYRRMPTGLGRRCEIEGLGWDPGTRSLLLGCKSPRERALRDRLVVFGFSPAEGRVEDEPRVLLPAGELERFGLPDDFAVSAVAVHPVSGTLLVAAARQGALAELSSDGTLLAARRLPEGALPQVEGLAVGAGGSLFLASEGAGGRPRMARIPLGPDGDAP